MRILERIRKSISRRDDELRIRIGAQHVSQNRFIERELENLWDVEVKVFSQWGEDGILDFLFFKLGISKPKILELGAGCFAECNSRFAAHNLNASVYAVDARLDLASGIQESGLLWRNTLVAEVVEINLENISKIIESANIALSGLDVISMDLDGNDYWLLERIPLTGISLVVVEYNPLFGAKKRVSVAYSDQSRFERHPSGLLFGASLDAFIKLLNKKGFIFLGTNRVGNNAFFVRSKVAKSVNVKIPNPSNLEKFVDFRYRDSRNQEGELNYLSGPESISLLNDLPVVDLKDGSVKLFGSISA